MAKMIAFYGSPGSGKTSISLKAAVELYCATKDERILFLSPDLNVPSIGLLFPNYSPEEVRTISDLLDKTEIKEENLYSSIVTVKSMKDFGCLGFKSGDSSLSFPQPDKGKLNELFSALSDNAEYIFVDCSNDSRDFLSRKALSVADIVIRTLTPDLKGMAWLSSHKSTGGRTEKENFFNIVCVTDNDLYNPTEEICTKLNSILAVMPYSKSLKQQMLDGRMYERLNDKAYNKKIKTILSAIK